jgi:tetratricopeptide (TPR) repeat protein
MSALGGDQVAASGDSVDYLSNPAALATLPVPSLWIAHHQSLLNTAQDTLSMAWPGQRISGAIAGRYLDDGSHDRIDEGSDGEPITGLGQYRFSTMFTQATLAQTFATRWHWGASLKAWEQRRDSDTGRGWAADAGLFTHALFRSVDAGVAVRNLGPTADGFQLPLRLAVGAALRGKNARGPVPTYFGELEAARSRSTGARLGVELAWLGAWIRGGFQSVDSDLGDTLSHFSFGAGLRLRGWSFDYAWVPRGLLGSEQRFSLSIGFGLTPEERERVARDLDTAIAQRSQNLVNASLVEARAAADAHDWVTAQQKYHVALGWQPNNAEALAGERLAQEKAKQDEARARCREAEHFISQQQWLEAAFSYRQALKAVPSYPEAVQGLKAVNQKIHQSHPSTKAFDSAYARGVTFYLDGQYNEAIQSWEAALKLEPSRSDIREYIEKAKVKKLESEVASLKGQAKSDDERVKALAQQAYLLYNLGETKKAIETWDKLLAIDPQNADARQAVAAARTRLNLSDSEKAEPSDQRVLTLDAEAMAAYSEGNLEKAQERWKRALALEPNNVWIRNNLARVERELAGKTNQK